MAAILVEIFARNDQLLWLERTHKLAAAAASLVSWLVESLLAGVCGLSMNRTRHVDRFVQAVQAACFDLGISDAADPSCHSRDP
jgi:hypothetical protein